MNMIRSIVFLLFIGLFQPVISQDLGSEPIEQTESKTSDDGKMSFKDRLFFGGNLGAQFGDYTLINVAPMGGIKLNKKWSVGTQLTYSYVNINYGTARYQDHIYGASLFSRYFIFNNFFAHIETEALNGDWRGTGERYNMNSVFVGGGYLYRITNQVGFGITALFNVIPNKYSPYRNPIINAGFSIGL